MKKLLIVLSAVAMVAVGCKKDKETKGALQKEKPQWMESVSENDSVVPKLLQSPSKLKARDQWVHHTHMAYVECSDTIFRESERRHHVRTVGLFEVMARRHTDNRGTDIVYYERTWTSLMDGTSGFFAKQNMSCYDGFLGFDFDEEEVHVTYEKFNYWTNDIPLFPVTLFWGIELVQGRPDKISFTKAICPVLQNGVSKDIERVIFKVEIKTGPSTTKTLYYDMSDDPT
jgi:hypothetical protein